MKIYISHSGGYDYETELYAPIKAADFYKDHTFFLPHAPEIKDIAASEILKSADLLIAEVSSPSTGQGIELGLASAVGVPIVCLYKEGSVPSNSLRFITDKVLPYIDKDDLIMKLKSQLF